MTATQVKVAEYRDLIGGLVQAFASLKSAANADERVREALWVRHTAKCLRRATCPRASAYDRQRAESWLVSADRYLSESGHADICDRRDVADANLTRMAFAGEWR